MSIFSVDMTNKHRILRRTRLFLLEMVSIIIGVSIAFWLNQWKDERNLNDSELRSLAEINSGLAQDTIDILENVQGHKQGLLAIEKFRGYFKDEAPIPPDSLLLLYHALLRDFISIQNSSPYEALRNKGLDIVKNDSLRIKIINMYDFQYEIIEELEENYEEMQFFKNYGPQLNQILLPRMEFGKRSRLATLTYPGNFTEAERKAALLYLMKIELNRRYVVGHYENVISQIRNLMASISYELRQRNYQPATPPANSQTAD
jgi:hypothetical protein